MANELPVTGKTPYRTLTDEAIISRVGFLTPITAGMIADMMGAGYDAAYKYMRRRLENTYKDQLIRTLGWKEGNRLWMMYIPVDAEIYGARLLYKLRGRKDRYESWSR